jgi:Cu/Ag efflux pump CusA
VLWLGIYEYFLNLTLHKNVDKVFVIGAVITFLTETVQHDVDRVFLPRIEAATLSKTFNKSINFSLSHAEHAEGVNAGNCVLVTVYCFQAVG